MLMASNTPTGRLQADLVEQPKSQRSRSHLHTGPVTACRFPVHQSCRSRSKELADLASRLMRALPGFLPACWPPCVKIGFTCAVLCMGFFGFLMPFWECLAVFHIIDKKPSWTLLGLMQGPAAQRMRGPVLNVALCLPWLCLAYSVQFAQINGLSSSRHLLPPRGTLYEL